MEEYDSSDSPRTVSLQQSIWKRVFGQDAGLTFIQSLFIYREQTSKYKVVFYLTSILMRMIL